MTRSRTNTGRLSLLSALLAPLVMLLCPALAAAAGYQVDPEPPVWVGMGLGTGKVVSAAPAPSADHHGFVFSLDVGYRFNPQLGLGLEFGVIAPYHGCHRLGCTATSTDFAPGFHHWFAIGEFRPSNTGWRLRAGAGISTMCYEYYKSRESAFEKLINVFLGGDVSTNYSISCNSLKAFGAGASIGYQWPVGRAAGSVGVQLRGETAKYAASAKAGTSAFRHRGVALQLQLNFN